MPGGQKPSCLLTRVSRPLVEVCWRGVQEGTGRSFGYWQTPACPGPGAAAHHAVRDSETTHMEVFPHQRCPVREKTQLASRES